MGSQILAHLYSHFVEPGLSNWMAAELVHNHLATIQSLDQTLKVLRQSWKLIQFFTYSILRVYSLILVGLDRFFFAFSLHLFRGVNFAIAIFHRTFSLLFSDRVSK